jgi:hypothetical protein
LHRLHVDASPNADDTEWSGVLFNALLRDPPEVELQWRDFAFHDLMFSDELTPLLLRMPSLERLKAHLAYCRHFDVLASLPRLTALELTLSGMRRTAWTHLLDVFTSDGLAHLHALGLHGGPCSSDDLGNLLAHTPRLTSLVFDLHKVPSLSFFSRLPSLAHTLTELIVHCRARSLTAADLQSLLVLQQLHALRLHCRPKMGLATAGDRAPFEQRPCIVLPHLKVFEFVAGND